MGDIILVQYHFFVKIDYLFVSLAQLVRALDFKSKGQGFDPLTRHYMKREKSLEWFNKMNFEQQFYKTIEANSCIIGDKTRNPNSLTGSEIEKIYEYHLKNKIIQ